MVGKRGTARLGSSAGTNPRICHGFHYDHALYSAPLNALVREVPYLHHLREEGGVDHSALVVELGRGL
jgi:hypothetical protein